MELHELKFKWREWRPIFTFGAFFWWSCVQIFLNPLLLLFCGISSHSSILKSVLCWDCSLLLTARWNIPITWHVRAYNVRILPEIFDLFMSVKFAMRPSGVTACTAWCVSLHMTEIMSKTFKQPSPGSDSIWTEWQHRCWVHKISWKLNIWQVRCSWIFDVSRRDWPLWLFFIFLDGLSQIVFYTKLDILHFYLHHVHPVFLSLSVLPMAMLVGFHLRNTFYLNRIYLELT